MPSARSEGVSEMSETKKDCPCPNERCRYRGDCAACREHHAGAEKPRPCGWHGGAGEAEAASGGR